MTLVWSSAGQGVANARAGLAPVVERACVSVITLDPVARRKHDALVVDALRPRTGARGIRTVHAFLTGTTNRIGFCNTLAVRVAAIDGARIEIVAPFIDTTDPVNGIRSSISRCVRSGITGVCLLWAFIVCISSWGPAAGPTASGKAKQNGQDTN